MSDKITLEDIKARTDGLSTPKEIAEYIMENDKYSQMPEIRWIASNYLMALAYIDMRKAIDELEAYNAKTKKAQTQGS